MLPNSLAASSANILATLINGLAGGLILTGLVWTVLRFVRRANATTRFLIWWGTLGAVVALLFLAPAVPTEDTPPTPPAAEETQGTDDGILHVTLAPANLEMSMASSSRGTRREVPEHKQASQQETSTNTTVRNQTQECQTTRSEQQQCTPAQFAVEVDPAQKNPDKREAPAVAGEVSESSGGGWSPIPLRTGWIPTVVLAGLLLIGAARLVRVIHGCVQLQHLKRRAGRLSPALEQHLQALVHDCGIRRSVRLRHSADVAVPTVLGIVKPTIIIPTELIEHLTSAEFEHVFLHELGHVRRRDDWTNLLQKAIGALLFFHPAVWIIGRQLGLEREIACDDWVIARTGRIRPYAVCLTKLVSVVPWSRRAIAAPGLLWTKSQFTKRIEVLLNKKRNALPRLSKIGATAALIALAVAVVQFGRVPPVVAVTDAPCAKVVRTSEQCAHPVSCDYQYLVLTKTEEPLVTVSVAPQLTELACLSAQPELLIAETRATTRSWRPVRVIPVDVLPPSQPIHGSITYEQLMMLLDMGVTGDYVRTLRKVAPEFTIDDLMLLRRAGIEQRDLEKLHRAGQRGLSVDDILRLRYGGVDPDYTKELQKAALKELSPEDIATLDRYGVSADYFTEVMQHGFDDVRFQDVIDLYNHGVSTDFLDDLDWADMRDWSPHDVMELWNHGVSADFIAAAKEYGFDDLSVDEVTGLSNSGVTDDYLEDLHAADINGLAAAEVKRLYSHGVSPDYAGEVLSFWSGQICLDKVLDLYNHGVCTDYLDDLAMAGLDDLSVENAIDLSSHGVSADLVEAVVDFDFNSFGINDIIGLSNSGVTADYLDDLSDFDLDLDPDDVIKLSTNGVTIDFLEKLQDSGQDDLDVNAILKYRLRGLPQASQSSCSGSGVAN